MSTTASRISKRPDIQGGDACIDGHRIPVGLRSRYPTDELFQGINRCRQLVRLHRAEIERRPASVMLAEMGLEISDFPPPDTVQGLWQKVGSATVPTKRQMRPPGGLSMCTL